MDTHTAEGQASEAQASEAQTFIVNVEAFVWHDGRYLMIVRGATEAIAPNTLTPPGGKVEALGGEHGILEATLRREVLEEVGVEVTELHYVESHTFAAEGHVIVDLVFLTRYVAGDPHAQDADEVAAIEWLTPEAIDHDARTMPWTRDSLQRVEAIRTALGWR